MAEVFLARRRGAAGIAKRLVVKRMRPDLTSDPRFAEMFLREARVATQLSHKNIVSVFDVGRDQEGLFLAMEYIDGPDLAAAMFGARERGLRFDPLVAAHIASEVAAGLDYAHRVRDEAGAQLGLVHRDITPRNILLSLDGDVKVTDFGVAVLAGDSTDQRRGTVPYMSPEQARGEPVDPRADLFSLGLVLYELLAGQRAYAGADKDAVLALARAGEVPPLGPDAPAELARLVARATAPRPDDRFASAREMQRDLAGWALGERGRLGRTDPGEHALASFLASAVPGWSGPAGEGVHGRSIGLAGTATLRSLAETAGGPQAPPDARVESTESTRRSLRPVALLGGAAIVLVAAAALFATMRGADGPPARAAGAPPPSPTPDRPARDPESEPGVDPGRAPGPDPTPAPDSAPVAAAERAEKPHRQRASAGTGTLELNAVPWAYVSIDGGAEEETPIRRVLSAGRHRVKIRNPVLERYREIAVDISPGQTARYVVDLRQ